MKYLHVGIIAAGACLVSTMLLWVGCEDSPTDNTITVSPASVSVTNNYVITFTAALPGSNATRRLYFPLEWSVSNPALGQVLSSTGNTAIYGAVAGQSGANVITVRDQAGSEGSAAIAQSL